LGFAASARCASVSASASRWSRSARSAAGIELQRRFEGGAGFAFGAGQAERRAERGEEERIGGRGGAGAQQRCVRRLRLAGRSLDVAEHDERIGIVGRAFVPGAGVERLRGAFELWVHVGGVPCIAGKVRARASDS
jgi:hypothetical protein